MSKVKLSLSILLMFLLVGMFSSAAFATGKNTTMKDNLSTNDSMFDNGEDNVNQSGLNVGTQDPKFSDVIKSDDMSTGNTTGAHATQKTHGDYQNNTNSCASCHQTHTGASDNLLFKNGEYATCTACHDGTLGFYNVFSATGSDSAGTFGGTHDGNMSVHLANGTVEIKAAPGGKTTATDGDAVWGAEFSCASCHAPHGSYSDRLLHPNPNHMGNLLSTEGGKRLENVPVVDTTSGATADYIVLRETLAAAPVAGTEYAKKGLATGDIVLQLKKKTTSGYVNDTDPWLHGYEWGGDHGYKIYWTAFKDGTQTGTGTVKDPIRDKEPFDTDQLKKGAIYGNGFAAIKSTNTTLKTAFNNLKTGNIARAYVVKLDVATVNAVTNETKTNVFNLWASKTASGATNTSYVSGRGIAMSNFCSSCHTDYLAHSQDTGAGSGIHSSAYRHSTDSDSYTCVRCHYAHGTDVAIMRDAQGKNYDEIMADATYFPDATDKAAAVTDYLTDKNPSSALKRYTNMAVCWGCHTSSHSEGTRNTSTYEYGVGSGAVKDGNGLSADKY